MEKTFMDWYLLGIESSSPQNHFVQQIIEILEIENAINNLNSLEVCLLVEIALKFGEER